MPATNAVLEKMMIPSNLVLRLVEPGKNGAATPYTPAMMISTMNMAVLADVLGSTCWHVIERSDEHKRQSLFT